MKNVIVSTLIVIVLSAGVCIFAVRTVDEACDVMEQVRLEAVRACESGNMEAALKCMERMQTLWQERSGVLSVVLQHTSVAEIGTALIESRYDLLAGEPDEFIGNMALLEELLHRLKEDERLYLSNILSIC